MLLLVPFCCCRGQHHCQLLRLDVIAVAFIDCARFSFYFVNHFFPLLRQTAAQAHTKGKRIQSLWIPLCWSLFCLNKYATFYGIKSGMAKHASPNVRRSLINAHKSNTSSFTLSLSAIWFGNVDSKSIYLFSFHFTFYFCKNLRFIYSNLFFYYFASSQTSPLLSLCFTFLTNWLFHHVSIYIVWEREFKVDPETKRRHKM